MASNLNNLFVWNGSISKNDKKHDYDCDEYWQKRTTMAADKAVRCVNDISSNIKPTFFEDEIISEARKLVRGWITDQKVYGTHTDRNEFLRLSCEEASELRQPSVVEVHKEWEHLVNKLETDQEYRDEIDELFEQDEEVAKDKKLRSVMNNLHKKSFVNKSQLRLVDSPRQIDIGKRMESRQEQVKRNREERMKNEEIRKMEKLAEKEARSEAMKMLKEEKSKKEINNKKEEELIQMEMQRIRSEIRTQRDEETKERERVREVQRLSARLPLKSDREVKSPKVEVDTGERFKIISEIVERKFLNKNKTMLRRCFQLWRDRVAKRTVEMTKAVAWNNWQIIRRVFRAWRRDSRLTVINRNIEIDQHRMRSNQRKESIAVAFWRKTVLKKCLIHWSLYVVDEKETRWFLKLEEMRKRKMESYIEVLQEKAKENQKKLECLSLDKTEIESIENNLIENSIPCQFGSESERLNSAGSKGLKNKSSFKSARSSRSKKIPTEAWQVTKKHANLPIEQLIDDPNNLHQESINFKALRPPKVVDTYVNRNATQKELIEHQRSKLKEQELLINELICGSAIRKVNDDSSHLNSANVSKIQTITAIGNDHEQCEEHSALATELMPKKVNKFVTQMEERAKEREKIKNERIEKQKRQEEEKRKLLAEQIAEQCKLEAEEKYKREQQLKEKREKEKIHEAAKKKQMQIEQEKNKKADHFYGRVLLRHYGIGMWKQLIDMKRNYEEVAICHYRKILLRKVFSAWFSDVTEIKNQQNKIITIFYDKIILRKCFYGFQLFKKRYQIMEQVAEKHYLDTLTKKFFILWRLSNHRSQIRLDKLEIQSTKIYERNLLKACFSAWKQLPVASRAERDRERRKEIMRQKVASIIPDFKASYLDK